MTLKPGSYLPKESELGALLPRLLTMKVGLDVSSGKQWVTLHGLCASN